MNLTPTEMTDEELEAHINSCNRHLEAAYARFERFHVPADRDAAVKFMHLRDEAIKSRSPGRVAALEACYFCEQGEAARVKLQEAENGTR